MELNGKICCGKLWVIFINCVQMPQLIGVSVQHSSMTV